MPRTDIEDLVEFDPEIERTLRKIRKEKARRRLVEIFEGIAIRGGMAEPEEKTMAELRRVPIGSQKSVVRPAIEREFDDL